MQKHGITSIREREREKEQYGCALCTFVMTAAPLAIEKKCVLNHDESRLHSGFEAQ